MKRLAVIHAVAIIVAVVLCANFASGQVTTGAPTVPYPLPQFLPLGSDRRLCDWVVTNRLCDVNFKLKYRNKAGVLLPLEISSTRVKFDSYDRFVKCMITNTMIEFMFLRNYVDDIDLNAPVQFVASVSHLNLGGQTTLFISTNLGLINSITSLAMLAQFKPWVNTVVNVTNMEKVVIFVPNFSGSQTYSNQWTASSGKWSTNPPAGYPSELAVAGSTSYIGLNQWYANGLYPLARIKITAGGKSMTYTGCGDPLVAPYLSINSKGTEVSIVNMARGGELVTIETSTDLRTWTVFSSHYLGTIMSPQSLPLQVVEPGAPQRFFRVPYTVK